MGKNKAKLQGPLAAVVLGTACGIVICLCGLAILTQLILTQKAGEGSATFAVPVLLVLSSFVGCQVAIRAIDKDMIVGNAITAGTQIAVMLIGAFAMDGVFAGVGANLGAVVAGGVLSCVLCLKKPAKSTHRKRRYC